MVGQLKEEKKRLGAFYTDALVVRFLVEWGVEKASVLGALVMDPACGDGRFLAQAAAFGASQVIGCDIDPMAVAHSRRTLSDLPVEVIESDFFQIEPGSLPAVDLMVGNPPFIRYQRFKGETRRRALASALRVGVKLTRLTASWAPFLLHAVQFLKEGGAMAMVVPAEIVQTNYGVPTLHGLTRRFAHIELLTFERNIFADAQQETFLLLAAGYGGSCRAIEVISLNSAHDLPALLTPNRKSGGGRLARRTSRSAPAGMPARSYPPSPSPNTPHAGGRWGFMLPSPSIGGGAGGGGRKAQIEVPPEGPFAFLLAFLTEQEGEAWQACAALLHPLAKFGTISNGYVSGANQFFHRTYQDAIAQALSVSWLRPAARGSKSLRGLSFTSQDIRELEATGLAHHLVVPESGLMESQAGQPSSHSEGLHRFIAEGEKLAIHQRFKCRARTPWWRVPRLVIPDLLVPYMISQRPRISVNLAEAVYTNTLHGIRLHDRLDPRLIALAMYSSATLLSMELEGRSYGGGVLKLEPSELARILIPPPQLARAERLSDLFTKADSLIRANQYDDVVSLVDRAFLIEGLGLKERTIQLLRSARERLVRRRLERNRSVKKKK